MADYPHYANYESLPAAIIAFGHLLREQGVNVGIQETMDAVNAATSGIIADKNN